MKAVCVDCECEMRCEKNEVTVSRVGSDTYRYGDKFKCPKCGKEIVIGFGSPIPRYPHGWETNEKLAERLDGYETDITIRG